MSSIPYPRLAEQAPKHREALRLARQLTPLQRHLVVRVGLLRWLQLPSPWQPLPGRQAVMARALNSADYALLAPVPTYLGGYELTALGELVAGIGWWQRFACPDLRLASHTIPVTRGMAVPTGGHTNWSYHERLGGDSLQKASALQ